MPSAEDVSLSMLELSNIVEEIRMQIESKVVLRCECISNAIPWSPCTNDLPPRIGPGWRQNLGIDLVHWDDLVFRLSRKYPKIQDLMSSGLIQSGEHLGAKHRSV
jgi:hypothetical protein